MTLCRDIEMTAILDPKGDGARVFFDTHGVLVTINSDSIGLNYEQMDRLFEEYDRFKRLRAAPIDISPFFKRSAAK